MANRKPIPVVPVFGGIAALGMIAVTVMSYRSGVQAFIGSEGYWMYLFPPVLGIAAVLVKRRRLGGVLSFREALRPCFGVIVVSLALQMLFAWVLVKWIDPGFGKQLPAAIAGKMEAAYRRFGVPEDQISAAVQEERQSDAFSIGRMLTALARNYIVGFIVAVVVAALAGRRGVKRGVNA